MVAPWTQTEFDRMEKLFAEGATQAEVAKALGRTPYAINHASRKLRASKPTIQSEYVPRNDSDRWEKVAEENAEAIRRVTLSNRINVTFGPDDGPIGIAAISDQHIAPGCPVDLKRAREDAERIRDTPGLFCVLGGDGVDNHIKHRSAMLAGRDVGLQWELYEEYLAILGPKVLAIISGNHDHWTKQQAGVDMVARIAKRGGFCYAPHEAFLTVGLGSQSYKIGLRHQYRFNSQINQTHAVKRWYDMGAEAFDIGVVCHHHEPALEPFERHGLTRWAARPGSYQITSDYSRQYGYNDTRPTCPTFILFPDRRHIIGFVDLDSAAWALRA